MGLVLVLGGMLTLLPGVAGAGADAGAGRRGISVVQIDGLLDPPTASLVKDAIENANEDRRTMLVIQIDSRGTVDVDVDEIVQMIERSKVPVIAWAGPSGGVAKGGSLLVLQASHKAFVANGASVGPGAPVNLDDPDAVTTGQVAADLARLAERHGRDPRGAAKSAANQYSAVLAKQLGMVDGVRPTLGEVVVSMDGKTVETAAGEVTLDTARVIGEGRDRPLFDVFARLAGAVF